MGLHSRVSIVRELFQLFDAKGIHNYSELSRLTGINHATIRVILKNPIYTGWRVTHQKRGDKRISKSGKTYRVKIARAEEDVIRVKVFEEPAIPQEVFDRVQAQIAQTTFNHNDRFRKNDQVNLGAGLAICGLCGEPIFCASKKKSRNKGYYQCKANYYLYRNTLGGCKQPNLRKTDLDDALLKLGRKVLGDTANLAEMIVASISRQRSVIKPLVGVGSQSSLTADLKRRDARLLAAFEAGAMTADELRARRADIRRQLDELRDAGSKAQERPDNGILEAARLIVKCGLRFNKIKDPAEQKRVLAQTFSKIIVREALVTSFEFNEGILPPGSPLIRQQILLDRPIVIVEPPEQLPDGCRRCIKCSQVKQAEADFYAKLNTCKTCLSAMSRHRYLTVRKLKAIREPE
ncbi:MAG: recombinase family protein [Verrucomicrobiota bacterium]